jgi:hypothetical protein
VAEERNDDRTIVAPASAAGEDHGNALPVGTRLGEFEITGLIGEGGFGIVYLAYDHSLQRRVALKEYMPSALAARTQGMTVAVRSARHKETFEAGLRSFVNEARLLAQFDHPSLVKVYRFWEANGTAFMVMPFYEGPTLKQALKAMNGPPRQDWLEKLLAQLLDALEIIHRENCFHRDIAPDNILLLKDGRPLLLDFGAARRVIGDMTQALTVILKPGYAPLEQYAEVPHMKQGAWTDIYALAAVVYYAITGKAPVPSVGRMMNDTLAPLSQAAAGRYEERFLKAIDRALAVMPEARPQSVGELRDLLGIGQAAPATGVPPPPTARPQAAAPAPFPAPTAHSKLPLIVAGTLGTAVLAAALWFVVDRLVVGRPGEPPPAARPQAEQQPVPPVPSVQSADGRSLSSDQLAKELAGGPEPAQTPPTKPFDPVDALDQIFQQRNRDHAVAVVLDKASVRIGKDKLSFRIRSSRPGHVYVLMVGTDRAHFNLLFPNAIDARNRIEAEKELKLPRPGWSMVAGGPPGTNHFVAIVSENPRDFSAAGLKKVDPFAEFPLEAAAEVARNQPAEPSPFAGRPVCTAGVPCSTGYGAATFTIDESR